MADLASLTEVRADKMRMYIGADDAPYIVSVEFEYGHEKNPVTSPRTMNVAGNVLGAGVCRGKIKFNQMHTETVRKFAEAGNAAPRNNKPAGSVMATHIIRFSHPDDNGDLELYLPAVSFGMPKRQFDGKGLAEYEVPFEAVESAGVVWRLGPVA